MTEKNPEFNMATEPESSVEKIKIKQRLTHTIDDLVRESRDLDLPEQRDFILEDLLKRSIRLFPELEGSLAGVVDELKMRDFSNSEDLRSVVIDRFTDFFAAHTSVLEVEKRVRENFSERGWVQINRLLAYEVKHKSLTLHVPTISVNNPIELRQLFMGGMRELARRLQTDKNLSDVDVVRGKSWIIYRHPKLLEKMGFTITEIDDKEESARMEISKDKLLELFK